MNTRQAWNINAVFLLLIFGFAAASILVPKRRFSETENRALAQRPDADISNVLDGSFEKDYEDYLTDQFPARDLWIRLHTAAERASLKQDVHDIYFAKDHYLIEKHTGIFTAMQADANIRYLSDFAAGITGSPGNPALTVMIVPNAVDILEEKLPPFASPYDEDEYLERIRNSLPEGVWVDSASVLRAHSGQEEQLFYRTDHHWTTRGAFYVFLEWAGQTGLIPKEAGRDQDVMDQYEVEAVTAEFEGTVAAKVGSAGQKDTIEVFRPVNPVSCELTYNRTDDVRHTLYQAGALEGRDKYSYFFGGNYGLIEAKTSAGSGRSILVIKDSYAHCFAPFLMPYFDQVDLLDLRYYNEPLSGLLQEKTYTDILFLCNAAGFAEDPSLAKLGL